MARSEPYCISSAHAEKPEESLDIAGSFSDNMDDLLLGPFSQRRLQKLIEVLAIDDGVASSGNLGRSSGAAHHSFVALWFRVFERWAKRNHDVCEYLENYDSFAVESLPREIVLIKEGARPACLSELPTTISLSHVLIIVDEILQVTDGPQRKKFSATPVICANGATDFPWSNGLRLTKYFFYLQSSETEQIVRKMEGAHVVPSEFRFRGSHAAIGEILGYVLPWKEESLQDREFAPSRDSLEFDFNVYVSGSRADGKAKTVYTYAETLNKDQITVSNERHGEHFVERKIARRIQGLRQVFEIEMELEISVRWSYVPFKLEGDADPAKAAATEQFKSEFVGRVNAILQHEI